MEHVHNRRKIFTIKTRCPIPDFLSLDDLRNEMLYRNPPHTTLLFWTWIFKWTKERTEQKILN